MMVRFVPLLDPNSPVHQNQTASSIPFCFTGTRVLLPEREALGIIMERAR